MLKSPLYFAWHPTQDSSWLGVMTRDGLDRLSPGVAIEAALALAASAGSTPVVVSNLRLHALAPPGDYTLRIDTDRHVRFESRTGDEELYLSGRCQLAMPAEAAMVGRCESASDPDARTLDFYTDEANRGFEVGAGQRVITAVSSSATGVTAQLTDASAFQHESGFIVIPAVLDATLQLASRWASIRSAEPFRSFRGCFVKHLRVVQIGVCPVELEVRPLAGLGGQHVAFDVVASDERRCEVFRLHGLEIHFADTDQLNCVVHSLAEILARVLHASAGEFDPSLLSRLTSLDFVRIQNALFDELGWLPKLQALASQPDLTTWARDYLAHPTIPEGIAASSSGDESRVSLGQQQLLRAIELDPDTRAYHVCWYLRWHGELDEERLESAWRSVMAEHSILRAGFVRDADGWRAVASDDLRTNSVALDLTRAADPAIALRAATEAFQFEPFAMAGGQLARMLVVQLGEQSFHVAFVVHHLVIDDASARWLVLQLLHRYEDPHAPSVFSGVTHAAFVAWDHAQRQQRVSCADTAPQASLPAPALHTASLAPAETEIPFSLDPGLSAAIERLAAYCNASVYCVLLSAFGVTLARMLGRDVVPIGTAATARRKREFERTLGFLVRPMVVRCDTQGEPTFQDVVARVRQELIANLEEPPADLQSSEVGQVFFTYQTLQPAHFTLADAAVEFGLERADGGVFGSAKFDFELLLLQTPSGLSGSCAFRPRVVDASFATGVVQHYRAVLVAAVAHADLTVSRMPWLSEADVVHLLAAGTGPAAARVASSLVEQIAQQASARPDAIAVEAGDEAWSYAQLEQRVAKLAAGLSTIGIGEGHLVAVCLERSIDLIVALVAVWRTGAAYLPLDARDPAGRAAQILQRSDASVLITRPAVGAQRDFSPPVVIEWPRDADPIWPVDPRLGSSQPEYIGVAYVLYTSGSTGRPKGVVVPQSALANHMAWLVQRFALAPADAVLQRTSIGFDASVWEFYAPLIVGGRLVFAAADWDGGIAELCELVERARVTVMQVVPSFLRILVDSVDAPRLRSLRWLFVGGELLATALVERARARLAATVVNLYGPTECTIDAVFCVDDGVALAGSMPIGRPVDGTRVVVVDAAGRLVPTGMPGELRIGGACLARGYLHDSAGTALCFRQWSPRSGDALETWYCSGDSVRWLDSEALEFLGRDDRQLKIRGHRVEPAEIEAELGACPGVAELAVLVERAPGEGSWQLRAQLRLHDGVTLEDVRRWTANRLPQHLVPSHFERVGALPKLASGKLDRAKLAVATSAYDSGVSVPQVAQTELEATLCQIWSQVLGAAEISTQATFQALGGDSLSAIRVAELAAARGLHFKPSLCLEYPSVGRLAAYLDRSVAPDDDALIVRDRGTRVAAERDRFSGASSHGEAAFVTGATGFLGAFMLRELLDRGVARVHCLVRASSESEALARLHYTLDKFGLWNDETRARLVPVCGDLSLPRFGLAQTQFRELANRVSDIVHCGAERNLLAPYAQLRSSHVLGTREVLRFAWEVRPKRLAHMSSLGVVRAANPQLARVGEADPCLEWRSIEDGYLRAKWVAEQLVLEARQSGLPASVFRLARLSAHSTSGAVDEKTLVPRVILSFLQTGLAFDSAEWDLDCLSPIDSVCQAIWHLLNEPAPESVFHLAGPQTVPVRNFATWLRELGFAIKETDYASWRRQMLESAGATHLGGGIALFGVDGPDLMSVRRASTIATTQRLAMAGIRWPTIDRAYLRRMLDYLAARNVFTKLGGADQRTGLERAASGSIGS